METIRHNILIQTLWFLMQLPTCQDGFQNCDKVFFEQCNRYTQSV